MSAITIVATISTAIGAVGAGGALTLAALAYRRQTLDRHREQASKISAWIDRARPDDTPNQEPFTPKAERLRIRNASDQPIFQVAVFVLKSTPAFGPLQIERLSTIAPEADETISLNPAAQRAFAAEPPLRVSLTFVDSAGFPWHRDTSNGRLAEMSWPHPRKGRAIDEGTL